MLAVTVISSPPPLFPKGAPPGSLEVVLVCCPITFYYNHCSLKQQWQFSGLGVWIWLSWVPCSGSDKVWSQGLWSRCGLHLCSNLEALLRKGLLPSPFTPSCWQISYSWDCMTAFSLAGGWSQVLVCGFLLYDCLHRQAHTVTNLCSLCSPQDRSVNLRGGVEARNTTLFGKSADQEDGRLASQNNHLVGVWMPVSFMGQRWGGGEETKETRPLILQIFLEWQASGSGVFLPSSHLQVGRVLSKGTLSGTGAGFSEAGHYVWL